MKIKGTPVYTRQQKDGLTLPQQSAVDLLVTGKNDKVTAELLGLSRTCVTKWRLYSPAFQAALNRRRAEVWTAGIDRLRSLIPAALDALAGELEKPDNPNRLKAALEVLRLAQLPAGALAHGPTDPEEIVRRIVKERREKTPGQFDDMLEGGKGLPPFEQHLADTWRELEERAMEPDEASSVPSGLCGGQGR